MRSLTLDSISDPESRLLLSIGNEKANKIWEKGLELQKGWKKPSSSADRKAREGYIKSKYMWKGFLAYNESDGKTDAERAETFSRKLYDAMKRVSVLDMSEALAFGADLDWINKEDFNKNCLEIGVLHKTETAIECVELLITSGAKLETGAGVPILDFATVENADKEMIDYLWTKLPESEKKDRLGLLLYEAAKCCDIDGLGEALDKGASVSWKNPKDGGKSALHICALGKKPEGDAKWNAIECVELLLGSGGRLEAMDNDGHTVMDCAVVGSAEREMVEFLATK